MMNALFDRVNWTVTELLVALEELDEDASGASVNRPRDPRGTAHQQRRAGATATLCHHLLRLLEFVCDVAPELVLGKGNDLNATRLAEIIAFGIRQLSPGSKIDAILARRGSRKKASDSSDRRVRATLGAELLAPYLGAVAHLERGFALEQPTRYCCATAGLPEEGDATSRQRQFQVQSLTQPSEPPMAPRSPPRSVGGDVATEEALVVEGARQSIAPALMQQGVTAPMLESALQAVTREWEVDSHGTPGCLSPPSSPELLTAVHAAIDALRGGRETGSDGPCLEEAPSEFLDPIMQTVMEDPVVLPHSGVTVDRQTIQRHLLSSATDPFSRAPLSIEELMPNDALKERLEIWISGKKEEGAPGNISHPCKESRVG